MEETEQLKKENADIHLTLRQIRNSTLEEAALVCTHASNQDLGYEELASTIRSMKEHTSIATGEPGWSRDWQLIMAEVERATQKFPTWPTDPLHAVAILGEEFGELTKAILQTIYEPHKVHDSELRTEAIQTAAMALRFLASLSRYEFARCAQHEQSSGNRESVADVEARND